MKSRKINLDRPTVDSKEIQSHKDFNQVLQNHTAMAKPFYKNPWFFGTAGMASMGLIIGGSIAFQDSSASVDNHNLVQTDAPPELVVPDNNIIAMNGSGNEATDDMVEKTLAYGNHLNQTETNQPIEETTTLDPTSEESNPSNENGTDDNSSNSSTEESGSDVYQPTGVEINNRTGFSRMDLQPRISGKINGSISRAQLLDNKGLTTAADVKVVHFELHLVDGVGGKVYEEDGNMLNEEMKEAIDRVMVGETIYFENIQGQSKNGDVVKLNPLRYVLMN